MCLCCEKLCVAFSARPIALSSAEFVFKRVDLIFDTKLHILDAHGPI